MVRRVAGADAAAAAECVLRLAVLLQAGLAPVRAWEHLASTGDPAAVAVAAAIARGIPVSRALSAAGSEWTDVAAAWTVATSVGAPLAESLRSLAAGLRDAHESADEVRVALAEPAGTARLMAWLPLAAVLLGVALGFDTLVTVATNPIGIACAILGIALIAAARRWTSVLVRKAQPGDAIAGLDAELFAIALSGGVSLDRALAIVAQATGRGMDAESAAVLELSRRAGVPAAELLRSSAALARHRARVAGRLRAAQLATRLLLPLGVCTLPAFLLLGVAPMMLSVMGSMSLSL